MGDTSSDTQPSTVSVRAWTGANSSAARRRSARASSKNTSSSEAPLALRAAMSAS